MGNRISKQRGATTIFAAFAFIMVVGMVALGVDVGYMLVTKAELQNAADVGATSATLELGRVYSSLGGYFNLKEHQLSEEDKNSIRAAAAGFMSRNTAAGSSVSVGTSDVELGTWDREARVFTATDTGVTSVRVTARRDSTVNGPVDTLLASALGLDQFEAAADAIAGISALGKIGEGELDIPVGIGEQWFKAADSPCDSDNHITFFPTGTTEGCAGWHTYEEYPANSHTLNQIIDGLIDDSYVTPEITINETELAFTGGTVDNALRHVIELYNLRKDEHGEWDLFIPVYAATDCKNPSGNIVIVGIASATITNVVDKGVNKLIEGVVSCDFYNGDADAEGGGGDFGTYLGAPELLD